MITLITVIFFIFVLALFSLFLDKKEFFWKIIYASCSWSLLFLITYVCSEIFLKKFDSYLWDYIFLKNFQDLLTIKIELAFLIANNGFFFIFLYYLYFLGKDYFKVNELFLLKFITLNFWFLNLFSFLIVRYDLFLSNWELLQKDLLLKNVDIQIDYLMFFHDFFDDWGDILRWLILFYVAIYYQIWWRSSIRFLRIVIYLLIFAFQFYFFGLLMPSDFLLLCCISIVSVESLIYFYILLIILYKINIKRTIVKIQI